jgi:hypothetical protein
MRLLALGAAIAIFTMLSSRVNAADLALPPPAVGQPQYGVAPPPPFHLPKSSSSSFRGYRRLLHTMAQ